VKHERSDDIFIPLTNFCKYHLSSIVGFSSARAERIWDEGKSLIFCETRAK
jgi:hypothetical protein